MPQYRDDYYEILQVSRRASQDVIQAAYGRLSQMRLSSGGEAGTGLLDEAYKILGNQSRRAVYDMWLQVLDDADADELSHGDYSAPAPRQGRQTEASKEALEEAREIDRRIEEEAGLGDGEEPTPPEDGAAQYLYTPEGASEGEPVTEIASYNGFYTVQKQDGSQITVYGDYLTPIEEVPEAVSGGRESVYAAADKYTNAENLSKETDKITDLVEKMIAEKFEAKNFGALVEQANVQEKSSPARDADETVEVFEVGGAEATETEEVDAENDVNTAIKAVEETEPENGIVADGEYNDARPRAVHRFVARYIDIFIYSFSLSIILALPDDFYDDFGYYVYTFLTMLLFPFIEAAFLHYTGRTLGKLLIGAKVCYKNGGLLSYSDALSRSYSVMIKGMGLNIPLITIFAHAHNYNKLETLKQETSWDASLKSVVLHKKLSKARRGVIMVLLVLTILIMILGVFDFVFRRV